MSRISIMSPENKGCHEGACPPVENEPQAHYVLLVGDMQQPWCDPRVVNHIVIIVTMTTEIVTAKIAILFYYDHETMADQ